MRYPHDASFVSSSSFRGLLDLVFEYVLQLCDAPLQLFRLQNLLGDLGDGRHGPDLGVPGVEGERVEGRDLDVSRQPAVSEDASELVGARQGRLALPPYSAEPACCLGGFLVLRVVRPAEFAVRQGR